MLDILPKPQLSSILEPQQLQTRLHAARLELVDLLWREAHRSTRRGVEAEGEAVVDLLLAVEDLTRLLALEVRSRRHLLPDVVFIGAVDVDWVSSVG